jgi:hypothetical protein
MTTRDFIIYRPKTKKFLGEDEKTWTDRVHEAQSFTDSDLARDIGVREAPDEEIFVFEIVP